jgi:hypothetical protein
MIYELRTYTLQPLLLEMRSIVLIPAPSSPMK